MELELTPKYPAAYVVHTPNGPVNACVSHTKGLCNLYAHLGCHVAIRPIFIALSECANCVNEATAKKAANHGN